MQGEREVAGLRCSEVLADLSAYLDDELSAERRAQIDAHLAGCNTCERFGGEFGAMVQTIQKDAAPPLAEGVADRLEVALQQLVVEGE